MSHAEIYEEWKGELPTIEELENVWDIPEEPLDPNEENEGFLPEDVRFTPEYAAEYNRKVYLLTWYLDVWLPMVNGVQWWGPMIRPYKLMTDLTDVRGEQKVIVTITSEAFGLLIYENCHEKWIEIFKWHNEQPKARRKKAPPQYNSKKPETHKFKAKWSDHNVGQSTGWSSEAYTKLQQQIERIQAFRKQEAEENENNMLKYGQELIRELHGINEDQTEPEPARKKRKVSDDSQQKEGEEGAEGAEGITNFWLDE